MKVIGKAQPAPLHFYAGAGLGWLYRYIEDRKSNEVQEQQQQPDLEQQQDQQQNLKHLIRERDDLSKLVIDDARTRPGGLLKPVIGISFRPQPTATGRAWGSCF